MSLEQEIIESRKSQFISELKSQRCKYSVTTIVLAIASSILLACSQFVWGPILAMFSLVFAILWIESNSHIHDVRRRRTTTLSPDLSVLRSKSRPSESFHEVDHD